jgi:hypothetical protein
MATHLSCLGIPRRFQLFRSQLLLAVTLFAAFVAGCGGGSSGTSPVPTGNTTVVVLASSTANDQLVEFPLTLNSLTLTSQSGTAVTLISAPVSTEFIHLNGNIAPLATVSIPQGTYTSATAVYGGTAPVCVGLQSPPDGILIDGAVNGPGTPSVTVNLPAPIQVAGAAMGLVLNLQVSQSAPFSGACAQNLSVPVSPVFNLTPLAIAAQPTNGANGKAVGLEGSITSMGAAGTQFTVSGPVGYWNGKPPVWQVSTNGNTVFQGIGSVSGLSTGMDVDMDVALQADGSLMATRVAVYDTDATSLSSSIGQVISPGLPQSSVNGLTAQIMMEGTLTVLGDEFLYGNASSQVSGQFANLQNLPFASSFDAAAMVPGQNILITSNAPLTGGIAPLPLPLASIVLVPQTIEGTVSSVSTSGGFTLYTVTFAPYDLFVELAGQPDEPALTTPGTVVVYTDSNTQALNSSPVSVGSVFRFYGLVFNDSGTLRMDCAQVNDGVGE